MGHLELFSIKTAKEINALEGGQYTGYPSSQGRPIVDNHVLQKLVAISSYIWLSAGQLRCSQLELSTCLEVC